MSFVIVAAIPNNSHRGKWWIWCHNGMMTNIIQFTWATEVHTYSTHYASLGNFFNSWVRTTMFGLKNLQVEGGYL